MTPHVVLGGVSATGTVILNAAAPSGGTVVALTSDNAAATVPANVTVSSGQTSATFSVTTTPVTAIAAAHLSATLGDRTRHTALAIEPATTFTVALNPSTVGGGGHAQGTITLSAPAPGGGLVALLTSDNSAAFPQAVTYIKAGKSAGTFDVLTSAVSATTTANITVTIGGASATSALTVTPAALKSLNIKPDSVAGGSSAWGYIVLNGIAPKGGVVVSISSNQSVATVPASVTVEPGRGAALFSIATTMVTAQTAATITATYGSTTETATLTVNPLVLSAIRVDPDTVVGGSEAFGYVALNGPAPAGGVVVSLASSDASTTVPASVTIRAGSNKAKFAVNTTAVTTQTVATLTAKANSVSVTTTVTVNPVSLDGIHFDPPRVVGGKTSTGIIFLNGAAPSGGLVVTLSSDSSAATVPATVTVPAGQRAVTFLIQTSSVTSKTKAQITATVGAASVSGSLMILTGM